MNIAAVTLAKAKPSIPPSILSPVWGNCGIFFSSFISGVVISGIVFSGSFGFSCVVSSIGSSGTFGSSFLGIATTGGISIVCSSLYSGRSKTNGSPFLETEPLNSGTSKIGGLAPSNSPFSWISGVILPSENSSFLCTSGVPTS